MKIVQFQYLLYVIFIFLVPLNQPGFANDHEGDSLQVTLSTLPEDTVKVRILLKLVEEINWTDAHSAELYAREALRISENLDYAWGLAHSKYSLSLIFKDSDFRITEELVLEALAHARELNDSNLIGSVYNTIGNLKDNVNETEDAIRYYQQSLEIFEAIGNDSLKGKVYNNLGIIYDNMGQYDKSFGYYRRSALLNRQNLNYSGLAINYLNMGYSMLLAGNLDSALHYLNKSYSLAIDYDYHRLLPYLYNNFGDYYLRSKRFAKAIEYAAKGEVSAKEQVNLLQEKHALILQKDGYLAEDDVLNAFLCSEKINAISDSIYQYNKLKELDLLEMRFSFEKERKQQQLERELLKAEIQRKELILVLIIFAGSLVIILFVFLYIVQNNRIRRKSLEQRNTLLEKEKLTQQLEFKNKELEFKSKELTTNVLYLLKKNEFISSISNKLKNTNLELLTPGNIAIDKIINELDRSVSEDNWSDFEVRFQEVHVGFYNKLSRQFPGLTPNELRLCAFLRLNMTSKEIAGITYQSLDSLKVARHRLRKKLGMDRDDNLIAFLTQL